MEAFFKPASFAAAILLLLLLWGIYNAYQEAAKAAHQLKRWRAHQAYLASLPDHRFVTNRITGQVRVEYLDRWWWTLDDFDGRDFLPARWAPSPVGPFNSIGEAQDYLDNLEAQRLIDEAWEPQQEPKE